MSYYNDCLIKFSKLPDEIRNKIGSVDAVDKINKIEADYKVELKFLVILVAIGDIEIKYIPLYLEKKFQLNKIKGEEIKAKLVKHIFSLIVDKNSKTVRGAEEKIKDIFQNRLIETLNGDEEFKEVLNEELVAQFLSGGELKQGELLKVLLDNQERITHKNFIIDGRPHSPSIANWLKDFIKVNGSGVFDNLVLTEHITNSENTKILDEQEKMLVKRLFLFYRNLKFFPESMGDLPMEQWEIIPIEKESEGMAKARTVSGPPATAAEEKIEELKQEEQKYGKGGLEEKAIEEEIEKEKKIEELRAMAGQYPEGSLERKAVEEEMRKLEL
ncbi:hypothetical protein KKD20_03510 [Patescibacteria group bacterium]|nr:hypothetical protein [Patescibacteria group bacterium]